MSGRRDSRVHIEERQNDALLEFENFKRKYLMVNKHITKLNSTLSVRVEELNAQLSTLYSENMRLRASEVVLKTQLKKERQRSHQIIIQTEQAIGTLMTQLSVVRAAHKADDGTDIILAPTKRKPFSSPVQPPRETVRLARAPADMITQIRESEEDDADEDESPPRPTSRRSSISRLPIPKHTSYCPLPVMVDMDDNPKEIDLEAAASRRKLGRRTSSLFIADPAPRAPSPVDGPARRPRKRKSNERRDSLEDEEREVELQIQGDLEAEANPTASPTNDKPSTTEGSVDIQGIPRSEFIDYAHKSESKQRIRVTKIPVEISPDPEPQSTGEREPSDSKDKDKRRLVIKDVTNSPRQPSSNLSEKTGVRVSSPQPETVSPDLLTPKPIATPTPSSIVSTPATENGSENGYETTSQGTGRERRTRKTLNYAEPKLNTKMRKPSPTPDGKSRPSGSVTIRRRRSIPAHAVSDEDGDADVEGTTALIKNINRRKTVHNGSETDQSQTESLDTTTNNLHSGWNEEGRRRSLAV